MIELYGNGSPNVVKVVILCEELGVVWRFHPIDVIGGDQYADAFHALNPNGRIPVIVDRDMPGGSCAIFESAAILLHLAETRAGLLPTSPVERAAVLQWLMLASSAVGPMFGQFMHFSRFAPPGSDYSLDRYTAEVDRLAHVFDRHLAPRDYLAGDYSIADVAAYAWFRFFLEGPLKAADVPALARWVERIGARAAVQRAQVHVDGMIAADQRSFASATCAQYDRFFNRPPTDARAPA